jgi:DNA repair photolyase
MRKVGASAELPIVERDAGGLAPVRDVEFITMPAKQILNRCSNPNLRFQWTINPYRGCEFGCVYCYARYTHEFLELRDPLDFERRIFVKERAAEALARNFAHTAVGAGQIALGTATDPYQPAERRFGLTRAMLAVMARLGGLDLSITTKSGLIVRDLDLLGAINARSRLSVNFSLITLDRRLQRALEPRAPRPSLRLGALARLAAAGIRCNVLMMPMIPGITDDPRGVEAVMRAARGAGAANVWHRALFLKPAAARRFIPFVREKFPALAARFEDYYGRSAYAPRAYDERLDALFAMLKRRCGFDAEASRGMGHASPAPSDGIAQRQIVLGAAPDGAAGRH